MSSRDRYLSNGYTLIELIVVLGIVTITAAMGWPVVSGLLERVELNAATQTLVTDIRWAQRSARAEGRTLRLEFDPARRAYAIVDETGVSRRSAALAPMLSFGSPADAGADGVTFRENAAVFAPRAGLWNSFGSVSLQSRSGAARRVSINIAGALSLTAWTGREWQ
jgi:prepilin-type N-terminal cleavage/methylation domain-containing protein